MKGQLSEHPLVELIREITASRLSGALRLTRERVKAVVYFVEGEAVGARSNLRAHRLAECLRRWQVLSPERLDALGEGMTDEEVEAALTSARVLPAGEFPALRARQGAEVLRPLLLWTDGEWAFDPRARIDQNAQAAVETAPLLMESVRRLPPEFAASRMGNEGETLTPGVPGETNGHDVNVQLSPVEAFVLSRVEGPLRLSEVVSLAGLPEAQTRQAVYALALVGLLARERWPPAGLTAAQAQGGVAAAPRSAPAQTQKADAAPAVEKRDEQKRAPDRPDETPRRDEAAKEEAAEADPLAEIDELFRLAAGETHYHVLGLTRTARPPDIKTSYYALAKRFHPDRFRRHADDATRLRIDTAFARIAQAYEVLKDAKLRAAYDLKLEQEAKRATRQQAQSKIFGGQAETAQPPQYRAEESFQQGLAALQSGNRLMAVMYFGEAVRLVPGQARYRAFYGRALSGDPSTRRQAEAELKAALSLDPNNASYHVMLAGIYRDLSMRHRAEGELQRALAIDAQHAEARRLLEALRNEASKV